MFSQKEQLFLIDSYTIPVNTRTLKRKINRNKIYTSDPTSEKILRLNFKNHPVNIV